jgi:hypothetical protein
VCDEWQTNDDELSSIEMLFDASHDGLASICNLLRDDAQAVQQLNVVRQRRSLCCFQKGGKTDVGKI